MLDAHVESTAFDAASLTVQSLRGHERLSQPFRYDVTVTSPQALDVEAVVGAEALVAIQSGTEIVRRVAGMIRRPRGPSPALIASPARPASRGAAAS